MLLTPRGEQLLSDCRSLLACAATLAERAQALRRGDIKALKVAASPLTIEALFPTFLHFYAERMPGVRLGWSRRTPPSHLNLVKRGTADVAINVINNMQVDEQPFRPFRAAAVPDAGRLTRSLQICESRSDRISASFATCRSCC